MDTAYTLLAVWALIGAIAGGLIKDAPRDQGFFDRFIDGALGGCVAGSLFHRLDLGLPFYLGTLLSAVVGAALVVTIFNRIRST